PMQLNTPSCPAACSAPPTDLHSFPTRRSSDLRMVDGSHRHAMRRTAEMAAAAEMLGELGVRADVASAARDQLAHMTSHGIVNNRDRKSTRLNSSHVSISYAVFCLKKKINYIHE